MMLQEILKTRGVPAFAIREEMVETLQREVYSFLPAAPLSSL